MFLKKIYGFALLGLMLTVDAAEVRLQFLSLEDGEVEGLFFLQGESPVPLRVPASFLADPISVPGGTTLELVRLQAADPGGPLHPQGVGRLAVPEGIRDAVVLVQTRGGEVQTALVSVEERQFPAGAYMIFNRTGRDVLIGLEEETSRIPALGMRVVRPAVAQRRPMPVFFRSEGDAENRSLVTTTWFHNPANREFVFLSNPGEGLEIRVRSVSRHPPPVRPQP